MYVGTHSAGHVRMRDSILANDGSARGLAGREADCGVHKDMQHEEGGISGMANAGYLAPGGGRRSRIDDATGSVPEDSPRASLGQLRQRYAEDTRG